MPNSCTMRNMYNAIRYPEKISFSIKIHNAVVKQIPDGSSFFCSGKIESHRPCFLLLLSQILLLVLLLLGIQQRRLLQIFVQQHVHLPPGPIVQIQRLGEHQMRRHHWIRLHEPALGVERHGRLVPPVHVEVERLHPSLPRELFQRLSGNKPRVGPALAAKVGPPSPLPKPTLNSLVPTPCRRARGATATSVTYTTLPRRLWRPRAVP
mmetsp:Transcript_22189/g.50806  ORF Transcript_22189/g.50806 Transcript_22189/m.50806 type:complete len:208 (+) Transcript_22189:27-650(+)